MSSPLPLTRLSPASLPTPCPTENRDDPDAEEKFKEISIAYQVLFDPDARRKYNEFGSKAAGPEEGFVDPEEVFGSLFGGEKFNDMIGQISIGESDHSCFGAISESPPAMLTRPPRSLAP